MIMNLNVIKENILALIIALVLSLVFVLVISKMDLLKWDIMATNTDNSTTSVEWDMLYYIENWKFIIQSNTDLEWLSSISLTLSYDPSIVTIDPTEIESEYEIWSAWAWEWRTSIFLSLSSIKKWEKLVSVKFNWDETVINTSDIWVLFTDWTSENLTLTSK